MKTYNGRRFFLKTSERVCHGLLALLLTVVLGYGCETLDSVTSLGKTFAVQSGVVTDSQAQSIIESGKAVAKTFEDFTPEQEYYIGRTVGAMVLSRYEPYRNKRANIYLNVLGQTLARASDLPETFGGYHFLIQDSDEINAFAAPGGLIFVTRGMLRCCTTEDSVAAVLAHEIGHVQHKHGLQAIKKSRITSALTTIGAEGAKQLGGENLARITQTFENAISDITQTLINNGYSRSFEAQADAAAIMIMERAGYEPNALMAMLHVMKGKLKPGGIDFAKTHPSPERRITWIRKRIGQFKSVKPHTIRQSRFSNALGGI